MQVSAHPARGPIRTRAAGVLVAVAGLLFTAGCDDSAVFGELIGDTVWTEAGSPYRVLDDLVVPRGVTLTIEPGATVLFGSGVRVYVFGRLDARGTSDRRIRMDRLGEQSWRGLHFLNNLEDNRMAFVDFRSAGRDGFAIYLARSRLSLDHVRLRDLESTALFLYEPTLTVRDSEFSDIRGGEIVKGRKLAADGTLIFERNVFARAADGEVIDFDGAERPGAVLQLLDNVFHGGEDDGVDLDGTDAHIEGNRFSDFRAGETTSGTSNAIAASDGAEIVLVRNVFVSNDHAVLAENDTVVRLVNNTVVGSAIVAIQLGEPGHGFARSVHADGNIFWQNAALLSAARQWTTIAIHRSIVPDEHVALGDGNLATDPQLDGSGRFALGPESPARGAGPGGIDMGADVPGGARLWPTDPLLGNRARFLVGGPGITHYRFRVNDGDYGPETATDRPIVLEGLEPGTYRIDVVGKNSAGVWQDRDRAVSSEPWTVD